MELFLAGAIGYLLAILTIVVRIYSQNAGVKTFDIRLPAKKKKIHVLDDDEEWRRNEIKEGRIP